MPLSLSFFMQGKEMGADVTVDKQCAVGGNDQARASLLSLHCENGFKKCQCTLEKAQVSSYRCAGEPMGKRGGEDMCICVRVGQERQMKGA